jgi:hydrogenase/urease accessory protein HupE
MKWAWQLLVAMLPVAAFCDEVRPAYLELVERGSDVYDVVWKVPDNPLAQLTVALPDNCSPTSPTRERHSNGASSFSWSVRCDNGLSGSQIRVAGLESISTDVLMRLRWLDESWLTARLVPSAPSFTFPARGTGTSIASTYLWLGVEHILLGFDHLLFVFGLLLIVGNAKQLVVTITSFTLAHSVTLVLATVGFVNMPQQPVEAIIALSIVFLAVEVSRKQRGIEGLASRFPWVVAFLFGLLHGFGFAGALSEIGLPQASIPLALVFFNVGVECGQLLFVGAMFLLWRGLKAMRKTIVMSHLQTASTYAIGGVASFWLIERVASF